jgi:hypothetical protein
VHLISEWIIYSNGFNNNEDRYKPRYSVTVSNATLFNYFSLKPKFCDWLMHCIDLSSVQEIDLTIDNKQQFYKEFTFSIPDIENMTHFKLMFYVEYFLLQNKDLPEKDINFNLRLLHFGNGCGDLEVNQCNNINKTCSSDNPNQFECVCSDNTFGLNCQINYCYHILPNNDNVRTYLFLN